MSGHLVIGITTLALAAWVDLLLMRIPNRLLLWGSASHLVYWLLAGEAIVQTDYFLIFMGLFAFSMMIKRMRRIVITSMGMGDVKLIAYLLLFVIPFLDLAQWLFSLACASIIGLIMIAAASEKRRARLRRAVPFAPFLFVGTSLALVGSTLQ